MPKQTKDNGWAAHQAEMAAAHQELVAAVEEDSFLEDWLATHSEAWAAQLKFAETATADEREKQARFSGFRTWRQHHDCMAHTIRLMEMFVREPPFQNLWEQLRNADREDGPDLYGPHAGGVPWRLVRSIECWYQQPKLTKAERAKHHKRIEKLCDDLLLLLEQVSPSGGFDVFRDLRLDPELMEALFRLMATPDGRREQLASATPSYLSSRMADIGFTPLWAVKNIAASAKHPGYDLLPPKVKATTALRTHFIRDMSHALSMAFLRTSSPIADALFAEIVGLAVGVDCGVDDVRKAKKQLALEHSREQKAAMVLLKSTH